MKEALLKLAYRQNMVSRGVINLDVVQKVAYNLSYQNVTLKLNRVADVITATRYPIIYSTFDVVLLSDLLYYFTNILPWQV